MKQNQPLQEEGKMYLKQSLVTGPNIKKYLTNKNAKMKSLFGNKKNHVKLLPKWKSEALSVAFCSHMSSHDQPRN